MTRRAGFFLLAAVLAFAAAYHALAVVAPALGIPGSRLRHGVWVPVCVAGVIAVLQRPRWLIFPFTAVALFGMQGHARNLIGRWPAVDWITALDIGTLVVFPLAVWLIAADRSG